MSNKKQTIKLVEEIQDVQNVFFCYWCAIPCFICLELIQYADINRAIYEICWLLQFCSVLCLMPYNLVNSSIICSPDSNINNFKTWRHLFRSTNAIIFACHTFVWNCRFPNLGIDSLITPACFRRWKCQLDSDFATFLNWNRKWDWLNKNDFNRDYGKLPQLGSSIPDFMMRDLNNSNH